MKPTGYFLIKSGHLIDPAQDWDFRSDILIKDGDITVSGCNIDEDSLEQGFTTIDASGLVVSPGFIDIHAVSYTHLTLPTILLV